MSSFISAGGKSKQEYEVVWCCPATRAVLRHEPRPARFKELAHARAFVKTLRSVPSGTFVTIRRAPVAATLTAKENAELLAKTAENIDSYKWEVVGRMPHDYTMTHMICDGAPLGFSDRAAAQACADFINQFSGSVRSDLLIEVVPWKSTRIWQNGLATVLNESL